MPPSIFRRPIKPALREAGIPHIGYHDFRHALISWLGAAGKNPKAIAEIVGHSDVTTTLKIYTHPSLAEKSSALAVVANQLEQDGTFGREVFSELIENK
jgi:integrase